MVKRYRAHQNAIRASTKPPFRLDYFHQVDDPHSHLVALALRQIETTYPVDIQSHVVSPPDRMNAPEPDLLREYALRDAGQIAPHYGLIMDTRQASATEIEQCEVELSSIPQDQFLDKATSFGALIETPKAETATRTTPPQHEKVTSYDAGSVTFHRPLCVLRVIGTGASIVCIYSSHCSASSVIGPTTTYSFLGQRKAVRKMRQNSPLKYFPRFGVPTRPLALIAP